MPRPGSPFADIKVRQAVAHAIDKQALVDNTFYGYATVTNQIGLPSNWAYNPNITTYPYDVDKAKALLAEANITTIDTTFTCFDNQTQWTAVAGMLAEIGINAKITMLPPGQWAETATSSGWEGFLAMPWPPDGDVSTRFTFTKTTSGIPMSYMYRPAENDALVDALTSATTFEQKKALTQAYQQRIFGDQVAAIPMWITDFMTIKYPYIMNDNFCTTSGHDWTPEDIWLDK
jgi:ABC-type transport system substrate-binding protein